MYRIRSIKIKWKGSRKEENNYRSSLKTSRSKNKEENNKTFRTKRN